MTPEQVLKRYYGYDSFRPGQAEVIHAALTRRDVLAIMPTGAGKSICYQVPAMLQSGLTIVFSPLISLMQDQVQALTEIGIPAAYINSELSPRQAQMILNDAADGLYKILYVAPERLSNSMFREFADNVEISTITVDEAHCISQWGQDFRPSYMHIADFIRELPNRPVVCAFTATATQAVKDDIQCILGLNQPFIQVLGYDRPNLTFEVETCKKDDYVLTYCREHKDESGIIYCATRGNTDEVHAKLIAAGIQATKYHAGLSPKDRRTNQEDFVYDRTQVMVATNAFGMGIDKSNVRYVIHYNMPQCMENYYQEAGRAGRDGAPARCILLFSGADVQINKFLLEKKVIRDISPEDAASIQEQDRKRLRAMERYCYSSDCLRNTILRYFGEHPIHPCGNCSNCNQPFVETDVTEEAKDVLACVREERETYGMAKVSDILLGSNKAAMRQIHAQDYKSFGKLSAKSTEYVRTLITQMIAQEYLDLTDDQYPVVKLGSKAAALESGNSRFLLKHHPEIAEKPAAPQKKLTRDDLTGLGYDLMEQLRALRRDLAREDNMPPYIICSDSTLLEMCLRLPSNREEMLQVSGIGETKFAKYGEAFLDEIRMFVQSHPGQVISTFKKEEPQPAKDKPKAAAAAPIPLPVHVSDTGSEDAALLQLLTALRAQLAAEKGRAPEEIFSNQSLLDICSRKPATQLGLAKIASLDAYRVENYGEQLLELLHYFQEERTVPTPKSTPKAPTPKTSSPAPKVPVRQVAKASDLMPLEYDLYQKLAALRSKLCKRDDVLAFMVFPDKILAEMCVLLPETQEAMLSISGIGTVKYEKYGRLFLPVIQDFLADHAGEKIHAGEPVGKAADVKKNSGKSEFYLLPQDAAAFPYAEYYPANDLRDKLNEICTAQLAKKLSTAQMTRILIAEGYLRDLSASTIPTQKGKDAGILTEERIVKNMTLYSAIYPVSIQRFLVEYFSHLSDTD